MHFLEIIEILKFISSSCYNSCTKVCILFYLYKNNLTQKVLIRPFCDDKHFTAAVQ